MILRILFIVFFVSSSFAKDIYLYEKESIVVIKELSHRLKTTVKSIIQNSGPVEAIEYCNLAAIDLTNDISLNEGAIETLKLNVDEFSSKIAQLQHSLSTKEEKFKDVNIGVLRLEKASADLFEHKIKKARKALDSLISQEKTERKKIKMLDDHEYDPNCRYCSDNKFVKDAHKAKESLVVTLEKIAHLQQHQRDLQDSLNEIGVDNVDKQIDLHVKLQEDIHRTKRNIEMYSLSIENDTSKLDLYAKDHAELCEKRKLYEDNKEAIENLSTFLREKGALERSIESKTYTYKKCQDRITEILVEQGSTKQILQKF